MITLRLLRCILFTALILGLAFSAAQAQKAPTTKKDTTDDFDLSDIPVDDITPPYFGVGGGYQGALAFMNFDGLNGLARSLGLGEFSGQLFMNGGGGTAMVAIIKNVRIGFYGASGSKEVSKDIRIGTQTYTRTLRFSTGMAAVQFDYVFTFLRPLCIVPGLLIGGGGKTVETVQSLKSGETFGSVFDSTAMNGGTPNNSRGARIINAHLIYYPQINFEYSPTAYFMLRAGVGYSGSLFGDTWTDGAGTTVANVPKISADGLRVQFGLFVGVFLP